MLDEEIRLAAIQFAKENKKKIAKEFTDKKKYQPDPSPISAFMAGSPGAGKTELSKNLIEILEGNRSTRIMRIDGDDLRFLVPGYTGSNSFLFQGAVSILIEKIHDYALHQNQSFVLDGTFANYSKASSNIFRSLKRQRRILVFYVYQEPETAWKFTSARERIEGRNIPKSAFIEQFLGAGETVRKLSKNFGSKMRIFLVKKDFENNTVENIVEISSPGKNIDDYIEQRYTKKQLQKNL